MPSRDTVTIAVPLAGGVDTKTSAHLVAPTSLLELENGDFTKGGSVRARKGYVRVPAVDVNGAAITDALSAAKLGDGYVLLGRTNAYMLDRVKNAWCSLGAYTSVTHEEREVAYSSVKQSKPDLDTTNGVTAVVWEDSRGGIRCTILDDASGAAFVSEYSIAASDAETPKVTAVGTNFLITWFKPTTDAILARVVKSTDVKGTIGSSDVTLAADVNADGAYDIVGGTNEAYLVFHQDAAVADRARLFGINSFGTVTKSITVSAIVPKDDIGPAVVLSADGTDLFVAYVDETGTPNSVVVYKVSASDFVVEASAIEAVASDPFQIALSPSADGGVKVWKQTTVSPVSASTVTVQTFDSALTEGASSTMYHSQLATSGFYDGFNSYAIVAYIGSDLSNIQNTYFLYRDDGVMVGRILPGSADPMYTWPSRVKAYGADKFQVALAAKRQVRVNLDKITGALEKQSPVFEHQGAQRCIINVAPRIHAVEVDGVLYTSGGFMWVIDGAGQPTEAQFLMFPDQVAASMTVTAGGSLTTNSTYGYRVYYEWVNARGQRVRSLALTLTVDTTANRTVDFVLQSLFHTRMQGRSPVSIVVYRTEANQTGFYYRVSSSDPTAVGDNGYAANVNNASSVTFGDAMADTTLVQQEIDYLSHGETDHFAFDAPAVVAAVGNRVFCGGGGQYPDRPQFSLLRRDGRPVEANDTFNVSEFPEFGGKLTGFADVNGVPTVFKERAIYGVKGTGPTNQRGAVSDYQAEAITTDVGCTEIPSIVHTPVGVFFKSAKGIYLLDYAFNTTYVGAQVERFNTQVISAAAVIPDTNIVVFLTEDGVTLVYDYFYKAWGWYTNHEGKAAVVTNTDFAYLRNDGELYIRDEDTHTDAGIPYDLYFRTAPLHMEDTVQGFHRWRSAQVLGTYVSPHKLQLEVYYNRELNPYQTFVFDPAEVLDLSVWGEDLPWGGDTVWGGAWAGEDYNFEIKPKRQKHSAVSFAFRGLPGDTPGASFEISELLLEVGVRGGPMRLPATRKL